VLGRDPGTGAWFFGGRIGLGVGGGFNFDPEGRRPGAGQTPSRPGTTNGCFASVGANLGPLGLGYQSASGVDMESGDRYREAPSLAPGITSYSGTGVGVGAYFGGEVIGHQ
jgi:hypothetical protein